MKQLILASAVLALAVPVHAQQAQQPANQQQTQRSANQQQAAKPATQQFVQKAAIGDLFEIQSSELALEESQQSQIKDFAQKIVRDHKKSSEELKSMVQRSQDLQRIEIPTALDSEHQQKMQQLRSASGGRFDEQYRTIQVKAHEEAVKLFENYAKSGDNADLKQWAEGKVPILRNHLQMAQALPQSPPAAVAGGSQNRQDQQARGTTAQQDRTAQSPRTTTQSGQQGQMAQSPRTGQSQQGAAQQSEMRALAAPGPNHILTSDLRGTQVRGANNENIGDINDVLLDRDGKVVAVIVGVGGFLGIGEKNVAIPFNALEVVADASGTPGTAREATTGTARTGSGAGTSDRAQTDAQRGGTMNPNRIVLRGMTKQDLEQAPKFQSEGGQNR